MANWRTFPDGVAGYVGTAALSTDTTIVLVSGTAFTNPASGTEYMIRIDNEFLLVTGLSTNTLTVTRAANGSTAAAHAVGALVFVCVCKDDFLKLEAQSSLATTSGTPASPTFTTPMQMAFDPATGKLYVWNGSAWKSVTLT